MSSLSLILKTRRKELGLTLAQIAEKMDVSEATVQRWESGNIKTLRYDKIAKLADVLHVSPSAIMGWDKSTSTNDLPAGAYTIDMSKYHEIPILGRISAGLPIYAEQNIEGTILTDLNGGAEYFALRVKGDSMNATGITEKTTIIVRRQDEVANGDVAVVLVGGNDATVKRFYVSGDMITLVPQSTNPEHQPQVYNAQTTPIKVLGKVIKYEGTV